MHRNKQQKRWHKLTKHHIVAQEHWWKTVEHNIVLLPEMKHRALHILHWNRLPHEQIEHILEINTTAIRQDFKDTINFIIEETGNYIYEWWLYRPWRYIKDQ